MRFFLAITVYHESQFYNVGIIKDRKNKNLYLHTDSNCYRQKFCTIPSLIEYYKLNPIIVSKNKRCVDVFLKQPHLT